MPRITLHDLPRFEDVSTEEGKRTVGGLQYKLPRCYVKSWSVSGDAEDRPTEDVALDLSDRTTLTNG